MLNVATFSQFCHQLSVKNSLNLTYAMTLTKKFKKKKKMIKTSHVIIQYTTVSGLVYFRTVKDQQRVMDKNKFTVQYDFRFLGRARRSRGSLMESCTWRHSTPYPGHTHLQAGNPYSSQTPLLNRQPGPGQPPHPGWDNIVTWWYHVITWWMAGALGFYADEAYLLEQISLYLARLKKERLMSYSLFFNGPPPHLTHPTTCQTKLLDQPTSSGSGE